MILVNAVRKCAGFLKKRKRIAAAGFIAVLFTAAAMSVNFAWSITVDGEVLAYIKDREKAERVIKTVEKTAYDALGAGYTYTINLGASATPSLTVASDDEAELESLLLGRIADIDFLYVISVSGKAVCAASTEEEAREVLQSVLNERRTENTVLLGFVEDVTIEGRYADVSLCLSGSELYSAVKEQVTVYMEEKTFKTEVIPFSTRFIRTEELFENEIKSISEGKTGLAYAEYRTIYVNGRMSGSEVTKADIIKEPVSAFKYKGVRTRISEGYYIWPAKGILSSGFGYRTGFGSSNHEGLDIAGKEGSEIIAADGGIVIFADDNYGYGNYVEIEHENGDITCYAHMDSIAVQVGDTVMQGQFIGTMGETGTASGVHLHFEYLPGGEYKVDPMIIMPEREGE